MPRNIPIAILRQIIMRINNGISDRSIAKDLKVVSRKTIAKYRKIISSMDNAGIGLEKASDALLSETFRPTRADKGPEWCSLHQQSILDQLDYFKNELKRTGVTLQALWWDYIEDKDEEDRCSYQTFCRILKPHLTKRNLSYHNPRYDPGEVLIIDFAGKKLYYIDRITQKAIPCTVLVTLLGYSQYCYLEVLSDVCTAQLLDGLTNSVKHFGGAPDSLLTDNMRQIVRKADRYEPSFTDTAIGWANHYGIILKATRVFSPKDKSLVERHVKLAYERIYAPLRDLVFYSLQELRAAVYQKTLEHNERKFQGKSYSRKDSFEADEKHKLNELPSVHYEMQKITHGKAQKNYHVMLGEDRHYYSVPYQLAGSELDIRYTAKTVEIYNQLDLVTIHLRNTKAYAYTTKAEHMPEGHKAYSEQMGYTGEDFLKKADRVGPNTRLFMERLLHNRQHGQQAYRSCLGLLSLGFPGKYGRKRLEYACGFGCLLGVYSFKAVEEILKKDQDIAYAETLEKAEEQNKNRPPNHNNLRGREAFD